MDFIAPLANPALFWPGLIIAIIGSVLIGNKKVKTVGTVVGYVVLAAGILLVLRSLYDVPAYVTDAVVLIILLIAAIVMIFAHEAKWYVRAIGVVLLILIYIRLKSVAPAGTLIGDLVLGLENAIGGLGALVGG